MREQTKNESVAISATTRTPNCATRTVRKIIDDGVATMFIVFFVIDKLGEPKKMF